jgi:enediyne biosynthesis protein E4
VTAAAGLAQDTWPAGGNDFNAWNRPVSFPSSATWLDFDGDGRLDLFVCHYVEWSPATDLAVQAELPGGKRAYVPPTQFPGTHGQLFRNLGGGRFADVSAACGVRVAEPTGPNRTMEPVGKALGVVAFDADTDGWPDLFVANDTERNFFFHNVPDGSGGRKFEEKGLTAGVAFAEAKPRGGMGIDAAHLQPDTPAVVVVNFSDEPNTLLTLRRPTPLLFEDAAAVTGLASPSRAPMKFGAVFLDFDLDGRTDLFTANGHLEPDIALARPTRTHAEAAQLFRNAGAERPAFEPVADTGDLARPMVGRGCAVLDFNGDGRPDLIVAANGGPAKLFRNDHDTGNRWVRLKLVGDGVRSNRDAIGARVEVTVSGAKRTFTVTAGRGYLSQSELPITVGLGASATLDSVTVTWPGKDAQRQTWTNLAAGREHRLEQQR